MKLENERTSNYILIGPLAKMLTIYEAPKPVQDNFARRVGNLAGTRFLPLQTIEAMVQESMRDHGGVARWDEVLLQAAGRSKDVYKRFRR